MAREPRGGSRVSRRQLLGGAGALGAAVLAGTGSAASASEAGAGWLAGVFVAHGADGRFAIDLYGLGRVEALFAPDDSAGDGATMTPAEIAAGDEITVFARERSARPIVVSAIESLYRGIDTTVTGRDGRTIATGEGELELAPDWVPLGATDASPRPPLAPGDELAGLTRTSVDGRELAAIVVETKA